MAAVPKSNAQEIPEAAEPEVIWKVVEIPTYIKEGVIVSGNDVEVKPSYVLLDTIPWTAELQMWAQDQCREYNVAYSFFLAMCESECTFKWQTGDSGKSVGYMQIRQCNWDRYEGLDVNEPKGNIAIGIRMIGELMTKYQEADAVIMAYKGGESAMLQWVEEGYRLPACDYVEGLAQKWQEEIDDIQRACGAVH